MSVDCSILLISIRATGLVLISYSVLRAAVRAPFVPASSSSSMLRAQRSVLRSSLPLPAPLCCARSGPCSVRPCLFLLCCARSGPCFARPRLLLFVLFCSVPFHSFRLFFSQEVSLSIVFLAAGPLTRTRHRAAAWVSFWTNLKEASAEEW